MTRRYTQSRGKREVATAMSKVLRRKAKRTGKRKGATKRKGRTK